MIQNALNETFSADVRVRFETAPDLVSGIELATNGQKVGWSIADYLTSLEKGVGELLKEQDDAAAKARAEARAPRPRPSPTPEPSPSPKGQKPSPSPQNRSPRRRAHEHGA